MTATTTATSSTRHLNETSEWTIRYTWRVPEGTLHPEHSETRHGSETAAIDAAVTVLDSQASGAGLRVVRAEVRGPGRDWRTVDWRL